MFYVIPAWYNTWRPFGDATEAWYRYSSAHRLDDTVYQLRLLEAAGQTSQLVVLSYRPQLRYQLHQFDLFEVPVFSVFDHIQGIVHHDQIMLDFRELTWPDGTEFIYSPFLAIARVHGELLAHIEFGNDGQLIWITYFVRNQVTYRYIFDDRGFLSSVLYYQDGHEHYQDYLDASGQCQIREYLLAEDCHVERVHAKADRFKADRYPSMAELVQEVVQAYLSEAEESACLLVADHEQHNRLLLEVKGPRKMILSHEMNRSTWLSSTEGLESLQHYDIIVCDRLAGVEALRDLGATQVEHLPLYDTRLMLGQSQRLKELIVYVVMDHLSEAQLVQWLMPIVEAMDRNSYIHLSCVTYSPDEGHRKYLQEWLETFLEGQNKPYLYLDTEEEPVLLDEEQEESFQSRVTYSYLGTELDVQKALVQARLIVDLQEEPDLYTQIAGISAGIPQVNQVETEFVEHLKNGYLVETTADLASALDYYLSELSNWNRSLVYAVQKIDDYTSGRLVKRLLDRIT